VTVMQFECSVRISSVERIQATRLPWSFIEFSWGCCTLQIQGAHVFIYLFTYLFVYVLHQMAY